ALAGARPGARARGEIEFDDVSFAYGGEAAGAARPVLRQASFRVAAGEVVALAGPSGGGKTTIADLILGFHRPSRGRIRLDGHDLASLPPAWLREQIAVVLQDAVVFGGTIAENIAFGRPEADFAAIRSAARAAQAEEFIARLPQGYETRVGERGARLSGGQRQRLAIARALLRDAPIVIFDEASSHLDGDCESALNAALARALAGRTVILISHRPASLALADRVLIVADGGLRHAQRAAEAEPFAPAAAAS
ncbi:MAG: ATP-binding cassette domain-containing protein, partial [Terriglobales bacterium]